MSKPNEDLILDILEIIPYPLCHVLLVRVSNPTSKNIAYNMNYLLSKHGINMLKINPKFQYKGTTLLNTGNLKKNESVTGLVVLQKNFVSTTSPCIFFAGSKHKKKVNKNG
jgi:hypothetical protein